MSYYMRSDRYLQDIEQAAALVIEEVPEKNSWCLFGFYCAAKVGIAWGSYEECKKVLDELSDKLIERSEARERNSINYYARQVELTSLLKKEIEEPKEGEEWKKGGNE